MGWALKENWSEQDKERLTFGLPEAKVGVYLETSEGLCVPRGYEGFIHPTHTNNGAPIITTLSPISLREEQVPAVDTVINALDEPGKGAVLFAPCGKGKTVMGLEILRRLGRRTLVLVHKEFLVEQWIDRAKVFLPGAKVGVWQRDSVPTDKFDIVIGMVQSIVNPRRTYPEEMYNQFGVIIIDETHRYAAPLWQEAISRFPASYRVGLTATPERKDQLHGVFFAHIGPIVYRMEGHSTLPLIWRISLPTMIPPHLYKMWNSSDVNTSKLTTLISKEESRTNTIVDYAYRASTRGRKVLVLSERVAHVKEMHELLESRVTEGIKVGVYIGGLNSKQRDIASTADIICGTYAMAQEGLDIPRLDTLLLATPKTSITQSVGRILRECEGKKPPVVVDFTDDNIAICKAYWGARKKLYLKLGYKLLDM
jgi:superfamily II DNA or RNA helicase